MASVSLSRRVGAVVCAMAILPVAASAETSFDAGADLRIRQEFMDNVPYGGYMGEGVPSQYMNWLKFRTRVWAEASGEGFRLYGRIANEFRAYPTDDSGSANTKNWRFPDELFLDNLYLDLLDIGGMVDLRVGRQDFVGPDAYGSGRILMDGNNIDGSRSQFFDAIRLRLKESETESTDLLGIYNGSLDVPNIGSTRSGAGGARKSNRWRNTIRPGYVGVVEAGGGLYHRSRSIEDLPLDLYWIFKHESDGHGPEGDVMAGRDMHTVGFLAKPKFGEALSGEFEAAYQFGEKEGGADISAWMGYAGLRYDFKESDGFRPWAKASVYYLSGDSTRSTNEDTDRAWDPVWARWPQFSELWTYTMEYGIAYLSNLVRPALECGVRKGPVTVSGQTGPLFAAEDDGLGGGSGRDIGWFSEATVALRLTRGDNEGRGSLSTHVRGELLDPSGDYFATDHTAYFLRWEVLLAF